MASDKFTWNEEDVLGDIIADWSCPEINYPLNMDSVSQFRAWLTDEKPYPAKPLMAGGRTRLVSVRRKEKI